MNVLATEKVVVGRDCACNTPECIALPSVSADISALYQALFDCSSTALRLLFDCSPTALQLLFPRHLLFVRTSTALTALRLLFDCYLTASPTQVARPLNVPMFRFIQSVIQEGRWRNQ